MSSPYEFAAACEGYFDKEDKLDILLRKHAFVVASALGAKIRKPQELWEVFIDKQQVQTDTYARLTEEEYAEIKKLHGIN